MSKNQKSSILKNEENQAEKSRTPRRVSWHSIRIVKEFGSDTDETSEAPKHEPMHLSDGSTNVSVFEKENNPRINASEAESTLADPFKNNEGPNQTLMFFQNKEENRFTVHHGDSTLTSETTLNFLDQLPPNVSVQSGFGLRETTVQNGLEKTMGFFGGLDPRFVSPAKTNTSFKNFDFTPVHVKSPTSENSPMGVDTEVKELFDESGISPIKCFSNDIQTKVPEQFNFEKNVNMVDDIQKEKFTFGMNLENTKMADEREIPQIKKNFENRQYYDDDFPVMFEVSRKIRDTSRRVMAEYSPELEELKMKARRISDRIAEISQARRRSSLLNSPADQINATLSEMFEKPRGDSTQVISDPALTQTFSDRSFVSDSLIGSGALESQTTDPFSKSLNSSVGIDGGTYTVRHSPVANTDEKPLEPRMTSRSFYVPGFSSPLHMGTGQMLDDIHTPVQLVTMNESEFMKRTLKLNDSAKSDADTATVEAMIHDDILNITTPTKKNISKSGGGTYTVTPGDRSNIANPSVVGELFCEEILNSPISTAENSFRSISSSSTLPIASSTPGRSRMSYLQSLNLLVPLENDEEEIHEVSAIDRFPHLAELMKEEKEWKESQGKNTSINYSKKYANGDSRIVDNSSMMVQSMACTPGKGMRGIEPLEMFEEESFDSSFGHSFVNSSINSGKIEKQESPISYTLSSYGCCTRQLNPNETSLMRQLESQIDQLKVFGENLTKAVPEIARMCRSLKAEWIVYEERPLLSSIYYLSEITIVDLLFKALNGSGVDKKINEVLFCTAKKAEETYSTALKLFNEMRITFPKSKFAEKLGKAFFKDRLTNPEKKETYVKTILEKRKRNSELKNLHEQRMKELKEKVSNREQELAAESERLNQLYNQTVINITENFKKLVK